ncbi:MAG TPA: DUF2061 domain-containing protein [Macromonas sp.]|nr:DUF2061 domain-containing protein [Macromonas sp.]
MAHIRHMARTHRRTLMKTGSYYVMHIVVAATVAYTVTQNVWASLTLSLLEPSVQAVAYFFHERAWTRHDAAQATQGQLRGPVPGVVSAG